MISPLASRLHAGRPFDWIREATETRRAENLQNGKLAWPEQEDRREHQANAGSKHCQGSEQQAAKYEQPVPPTHCR
jgi:hypothetical protein